MRCARRSLRSAAAATAVQVCWNVKWNEMFGCVRASDWKQHGDFRLNGESVVVRCTCLCILAGKSGLHGQCLRADDGCCNCGASLAPLCWIYVFKVNQCVVSIYVL